MRNLYPNFRRDEHEYAQAERYWHSLWDVVMRFSEQSQEWTVPWLQTSYGDGTPMRDGDPMFSAICPTRRLAIHVIQNEPGEGEADFDADVSMFDPEVQGIRVLVLSCSLSELSANGARELLRAWVESGQLPAIQQAMTA